MIIPYGRILIGDTGELREVSSRTYASKNISRGEYERIDSKTWEIVEEWIKLNPCGGGLVPKRNIRKMVLKGKKRGESAG